VAGVAVSELAGARGNSTLQFAQRQLADAWARDDRAAAQRARRSEGGGGTGGAAGGGGGGGGDLRGGRSAAPPGRRPNAARATSTAGGGLAPLLRELHAMALELDVDAASYPRSGRLTRGAQAATRGALLLPLGAALELSARREAAAFEAECDHPLAAPPLGCRWGGAQWRPRAGNDQRRGRHAVLF
jgi:hypothetical protein